MPEREIIRTKLSFRCKPHKPMKTAGAAPSGFPQTLGIKSKSKSISCYKINPSSLHLLHHSQKNTSIYREIFNIHSPLRIISFYYCLIDCYLNLGEKKIKKMSHTAKAWIVAASIGAVEALKDQGICRWNYAMRSIHQHAKSNLGSFSQAKKLSSSSSSSAMAYSNTFRDEKAKQSEESRRTVMYLSCWGPN